MNAVVKSELIAQSPQMPVQMAQAMLEKGLNPEQVSQMLDVQQKWEANEARKAFYVARAAFAANPPKVFKDKVNNQFHSRYSSIANLVNTVQPALSAHGLHATWTAEQTGGTITVTCILAHERGHSERVPLSGPVDTSGAKNSLQQIKSTITYLKIATFELVTGIASEDGNLDDDGNNSGKPPEAQATDEQLATIAEYREAEQIPEVTLKWLDKQEALTEKQATSLIAKIKKANK